MVLSQLEYWKGASKGEVQEDLGYGISPLVNDFKEAGRYAVGFQYLDKRRQKDAQVGSFLIPLQGSVEELLLYKLLCA